MSSYRQIAWFIIAPLAVACSDAGNRPGEPPELDTEVRSASVATPPTADDVCSSHRWVGVIQQNQSCPASVVVGNYGVWEQTWLTGTVAPTSPSLQKVCAYTWVPVSASYANPDAYTNYLPNDGTLLWDQWLSRDCQITAPVGAPVPPVKVGADLNGKLMTQVDAPLKRKTHPSKQPARVRVAVLDTAPDSPVDLLIPGRNGHGYALARMIENVTCPKHDDGTPMGTCLAQPRSVLAMPYVGPDEVDPKEGGHSGTPWTLASAITRTVDRYVQEATQDPKDGPQHLVLNLSMGWEPRWGGAYTASPDELDGPLRAVHDALVHARCHGALVLAAAGNVPGGPEKATGAMYPAAWEIKAAPSPAECVAFEGGIGTMLDLPYRPFPDYGYRPLVHAVGGVDGADTPLRRTRSESMPRIVAPAAMAAGLVPKGTRVGHPGGGHRVTTAPESTRVLTGTSVSTALVSSAATTLWAFRPELSTSDLMEVLWKTGADLNQPPKLPMKTHTCLGGGACTSTPHRLSICNALEAVCSSGVSRCPVYVAACQSVAPYGGKASMPGSAAMAAFEAACQPWLKIDGSTCVETFETPDVELFGTQVGPRLTPQPGDHFCSACFMQFDPRADMANITISIDPRTTADLGAAAVHLYSGRSTSAMRVDLSEQLPATLVPGETYRIRNVPVRVSSNLSAAEISFQLLSDPAARSTRMPQSVTESIPHAIY